MDEAAHSGIADAVADSPSDVLTAIATLRAEGAGRFDPVRMHYLEALARRAAAHRGSAGRLLDARLAQALAAFRERFDAARSGANEIVTRCARQHPHVADELRRRCDAGDFEGVRRFALLLGKRGPSSALHALVRELEAHAAEESGSRVESEARPRPELKTLRTFRNAWSKMSVDLQVRQALGQAPKNAGPINSHMLMLRSLSLMRDMSPDYLNRFMSYAETLLSLEQDESERAASPKKPQTARQAKTKG